MSGMPGPKGLNGPGTSVTCPMCGARNAEKCTTATGRDHTARTRTAQDTSHTREKQ